MRSDAADAVISHTVQKVLLPQFPKSSFSRTYVCVCQYTKKGMVYHTPGG